MEKRLSALFAVLLISTLGFAQTKEITARVIDTAGNPIPNASIKVKGVKTGGVSAGDNGVFRITVPVTAILQVSAVDFEMREIPAANVSGDIRLVPMAKALTEIVVTALNIKREKRSLGYATQTIGNDQINKSGSGNPLGELEGKVSGLTVINSSGDPGAGTYLQLRGVTSLTGDNQPLIVIDGVPVDNSINQFQPVDAVGFTASGANGNQTGGTQPTNRGIDINPNDIESINVLKGPAATALYGINAASGAIIITTKKGTPGTGKINIDVNSSVTFDRYNKLPGLQNQYAQGTFIDPTTPAGSIPLSYLSAPIWVGPDGLLGDGSAATSPNTGQDMGAGGARVTWGPAIDTLYWTGVPNDYDQHGRIVGQSSPLAKIKVHPYNQYDVFQTGITTNNNIAMSGGNEASSYRVSLGNLNQKGIIPLTQYNKTTVSVSGQSRISDRLTVASAITFITSSADKVQQGSNQSGFMLGLVRTPPTFDNANGFSNAARHEAAYVIQDGSNTQRNYRGGVGYDNPYWIVNRIPFHENLDRVLGNLQANYQLLDWMTLTYRLGGDVYSQFDKNAYDIGSNAFTAGAIYLANFTNRQFNSDFTVNMHKDFAHDLSGSLLVGHNYFYEAGSNFVQSGSGFALPNFLDMSNASSYQNLEGSPAEPRKRTMAFYADAELSYRKMLYLSLTGRREESSTLPVNHNTFFYPSASLGWVFTELESLKGNSILSFGKLRTSFAQVGKDAPIQGLQTYYVQGAITDGFTTGVNFPINGQTGYQISSLVSVIGNPDLQPEKTNSYEIGTDLSFVHNRINLSATWYYSKTMDAIFQVPIAFSSGFAAELKNAGVLSNKGLELSLNTTPVKVKDFRWDLNLNWSRNVNKVISLANGVQQLFLGGFTNGGIYAVAGEPFGTIYGSAFERISATSNTLLINDNQTDPGYAMPIPGSQTRALGRISPDWIGSIINNFSYKAFTLGCQIDWRHGGQLWNGTRGAINYFGTGEATANRGQTTVFQGQLGHLDVGGNVVHYASDGVTELPGPGVANTATATYNQYYWQNIGSSFIGPTEPDVEDASFIKLRQVSLSYSLPKQLIKKSGFKTIALTAFVNNIILWTPYKGVDPETSLAGPSNAQGSDYFNNPSTKSMGLRLNLGL